jgi:hypothetical protein
MIYITDIYYSKALQQVRLRRYRSPDSLFSVPACNALSWGSHHPANPCEDVRGHVLCMRRLGRNFCVTPCRLQALLRDRGWDVGTGEAPADLINHLKALVSRVNVPSQFEQLEAQR